MKMIKQTESQHDNSSQAGAQHNRKQSSMGFTDKRSSTAIQRKLIQNINNSSLTRVQQQQINSSFGNPIQKIEMEDELLKQAKFDPVQQMQDSEAEKAKLETVQTKENKTGLPDNLKTGIESLSGMDMSNVRVHTNSSKPAQLNAHAYAQGNDIHLGSGQEQHLPHEAWHVVQQAQGRVNPTMEMGGSQINDDASLETEADVMGEKAVQHKFD